MTATATEIRDYFAERFEHYRALGEDWGTAADWAHRDADQLARGKNPEQAARGLAALQTETRFARKVIEKTELGLFTWAEAAEILTGVQENLIVLASG